MCFNVEADIKLLATNLFVLIEIKSQIKNKTKNK